LTKSALIARYYWDHNVLFLKRSLRIALKCCTCQKGIF